MTASPPLAPSSAPSRTAGRSPLRGRRGEGRSPGGIALAGAALALIVLLLIAGFWGFSYDDAFITYQYARTLQEDGRLAYGPGAATLGTSAPGYAVLLGGLARLGEPFGLTVPEIGSVLGATGLGLVGLLVLLVVGRREGLRRRTPEPLAVAVVAGVLLAMVHRWNVEMLGGETLPALGLVVLGAHLLFVGRRDVAAGLVLAAAALLRLDAGLAAVIFGLLRWAELAAGGRGGAAGQGGAAKPGGAVWRGRAFRRGGNLRQEVNLRRLSRAFPVRLFVAGAVPLAAYCGWLWVRFGQLLPDTLDAKQAETAWAGGSYSAAEWDWLVRTTGTLGAGTLVMLAAVGALVTARWLGGRGWLSEGTRPEASPAAAGAALSAASGREARPGTAVGALLAWLLAHELTYRLVGVPFAPWYHVGGLTALVVLATVGATAVAVVALRGLRTVGVPLGPRLGSAAIAALALLLLLPAVLPTAGWWWRAWGEAPDPRWEVYHAVGEHLRQTAAPGATVAAVEIGFLGYASRRPILDLMGLVDRRVVAARQEGRLAELVAEERPEYLLDVPLFRAPTLETILADPAVRECYRRERSFAAPAYLGGAGSEASGRSEVHLLRRSPGAACAPPLPRPRSPS